MFRNTIIVSILNILAMGLSFSINILISSNFGTGYEVDSYTAAIALPNYIVTVITGSLSYTFIPVFSKYRDEKPEEAWSIVYSCMTIVLVIITITAIILFLFAPSITRFLIPGFSEDQLAYTAKLFRIYVPIIILSSLTELIASVFYSHGKFASPLINKLITPFFSFLIVFFFSQKLNIVSLVLANLIGAIFQFLILFSSLKRNTGFGLHYSFSWSQPGVKLVFRLMLPLFFSSLLYKLFPVFDAMILSDLPPGSISSVGYASKIHLAIATVITSVFSVQVFSLLADISAKGDMNLMKVKISLFVRLLLFVSIPISVFLFVNGASIVSILFQRGSFGENSTQLVYNCLKIYAFSLPAVAIGGVISQGLYALMDTKSVMIAGIFEAVFYVSCCLLIINVYGYLTVVITYVVNFNLSVLVLGIILRKRISHGGGMDTVIAFFKILLLAVILAYILSLVFGFFDLSTSQIIVSAPVYFISYLLVSKFLNFKETEMLFARFRVAVYGVMQKLGFN